MPTSEYRVIRARSRKSLTLTNFAGRRDCLSSPLLDPMTHSRRRPCHARRLCFFLALRCALCGVYEISSILLKRNATSSVASEAALGPAILLHGGCHKDKLV